MALESDERSLSQMCRFYPRGPKKMSPPEENVSGNIWQGSKVNFPYGTLNKITMIFAEFPVALIAKFVFFY